MQPAGNQSEGLYKGGHQPIFDLDPSAAATPNKRSVSLPKTVEWQASEYIHHDKGFMWVAGLALVVAIAVGSAIWFGQWVFAGLIAVMAVAFGYYAFRRPQVIRYKLTDSELHIGTKSFPLSGFTGFGVLSEGAFYSVRLIPVKRFSPAIVIYFGEQEGEAIVDALGAHIPMLQMNPDPIDVLMRKLRF